MALETMLTRTLSTTGIGWNGRPGNGGETLAEKAYTFEEVLAVLAATPGRIAAAVDGLAPPQLQAAPGDGGWSPNDVLAHLRSCADVWGGYMARILAEDEPSIRAVSPRRWIHSTDYPALEFGKSFDAYSRQRTELLEVLAPLPEGSWARAATVTGVGRPLKRTVLNYGERMARHEREHTRQMERLAAELR